MAAAAVDHQRTDIMPILKANHLQLVDNKDFTTKLVSLFKTSAQNWVKQNQ